MKPALWFVRALWFALPVVAGPAIADALGDASRPVQVTASAGAWLVWAATLAAMALPRTTTLTAVRIVVPASLVACVVAAIAGGVEAADVVAVCTTTALTVGVLSSWIGVAFADGSSYGNESRLPLRAPAPLLAGPVPAAWAIVIAGVTAGPMLLAARAYAAGAIALAAGLPAAWFAARALHGLSRRWIVVVPAGFVVHDPMTLADPVLLRRSSLESVRPAPRDALDDGATDLTANALGLAIEARLREPVELGLVRRKAVETKTSSRIVFTPTQPGALLTRLREQRIIADT